MGKDGPNQGLSFTQETVGASAAGLFELFYPVFVSYLPLQAIATLRNRAAKQTL